MGLGKVGGVVVGLAEVQAIAARLERRHGSAVAGPPKVLGSSPVSNLLLIQRMPA
jgi:hypothetical protein